MKKRILALFLSVMLLAALMAGCSAPASSASAAPSSAPVSSVPAGPVTFTDDAGREVEVPANITKVAPSGAMAQMFVMALAPDLMVSIASEYSEASLPFIKEEVSSLPVIGAFYGEENLNLEEIAALGAEVVVDIGEAKKTIVEDMDSITTATGIAAVHIDAATATAGDAFRTLGKLLGREAEAEVLAKYCDDTYASVQDIMAAVGEENKISALYLLGDSGLNVIATGSFHAETFNLLTNNLAEVDDPSSRGSGNETDLEQIMMWDPDVIFFGPGSIYQTVGEDAAWAELKAIKSGSYYEIPFGPYNWMGSPPSINRYLGMLWVAKVLYPEQATYDLYEKVAEFYSLMYGHDLTQAEYDELTKNSLPKA